MIVQVVCEDGVTEVPITPATTCYDVVECCRDPGDDFCALVQVWRGYGKFKFYSFFICLHRTILPERREQSEVIYYIYLCHVEAIIVAYYVLIYII